MTIRERLNNLFRRNVASVLPYEAIKGTGALKYQDRLVSGGYHDFWDLYSRKEVVLNDAIGERVTLGFLKLIFEKMPKFAENDEVQPEYIMEDVRVAIDTLQLKPKFMMTGLNMLVNGWCLNTWNPLMPDGKTIMGLACKIFGYEECHPRYWRRFTQPRLVNKISHYRAIYIPRPAGMEALYHTLNEERYILRPNDPTFQHLTRIDYNYGLGYAMLQPIWDAITKLREKSDSEHFLNSNYMEVRYPQSWTKEGKGKKFVEKARKATRRRGLAVEAVTNPQTNEDTGLPSVQYRPWGQGTQGQPMDKNRASAYLDGEWLRLLVNLGYSQDWATGTSAGQQEGSELNLTRDDRKDVAEFVTLEPAFKKMLKRLAELGVMAAIGVSQDSINRLLKGNYKMLCWISWEYNDKAKLQQEQLDHEMEMQKGKEDNKNAYNKANETLLLEDKTNRYNSQVETMLLIAIRLNRSMPMTPVMSAWIKAIGHDEGSVYMQVHEETSKGIDTYEYNPSDPEAVHQEWIESGSKGGYWWDYIRDIFSPAFKHGKPPAYLETGYGEELGFTQPDVTRKFKMEGDIETGTIGVGTTREPFPLPYAEQPYKIYSPGGKIGTYEEASEFMEGVAADIKGHRSERQKGAPGMEYNPTELKIPESTMEGRSVYTPGRVYDPGSITGSRKVGPGRKRKPGVKAGDQASIVPYNPTIYNQKAKGIYNEKFKSILNSASALRRFAKTISTDHLPNGWGMKQDTPYKIKELLYEMVKESTRVNRVSFGNSIKVGHPYNYGGDDEYICARDYKLNIGKTVPLGIYHNLEEPGNVELPDWQIIGTHEVLGWDDDLGGEIAKNDYDIDKIDAFFKIRNERNWIWKDYLSKDMEPPISGAYTCNVPDKKYNDKYWQINIDLKSMSFVPDGNCPWDVCHFEPQEEVIIHE